MNVEREFTVTEAVGGVKSIGDSHISRDEPNARLIDLDVMCRVLGAQTPPSGAGRSYRVPIRRSLSHVECGRGPRCDQPSSWAGSRSWPRVRAIMGKLSLGASILRVYECRLELIESLEGDDLEEIKFGAETKGLSTYSGTDSTAMAASVAAGTRAVIGERCSENCVPVRPRRFRSRLCSAQEAHEAILAGRISAPAS